MEIHFNQRKLAKVLNSHQEIIRKYGQDNGKKIMQRLGELKAADNLEQISYLPPPARHELVGDRKGQYAVYAKHPWRIVFVPFHSPIPVKEDGGVDLNKVTKILILEIVDYHRGQ